MVLFSDDFESGDYSKWTSTVQSAGSSTMSIDNVNPHVGVYDDKFVFANLGDGICARQTIAANAIVYARCYVLIGATTLSTQYQELMLMRFSNAVADEYLCLTNSSRFLDFYYKDGGGWHQKTSTTGLSLNKWYCIEMLYDYTNGAAKVYLNGSEVTDLTTTGLTLNESTIIMFSLGNDGYGAGAATATIYVDDVVIDTSYIRPIMPPTPLVTLVRTS